MAVQRMDQNSLFNNVKRMIRIRKEIDAFGWGDLNWINDGGETIAAYIRTYEDMRVLVINNLSGETISLEFLNGITHSAFQDLFSENKGFDMEQVNLPEFLKPYEYKWLRFI